MLNFAGSPGSSDPAYTFTRFADSKPGTKKSLLPIQVGSPPHPAGATIAATRPSRGLSQPDARGPPVGATMIATSRCSPLALRISLTSALGAGGPGSQNWRAPNRMFFSDDQHPGSRRMTAAFGQMERSVMTDWSPESWMGDAPES